MPAAAIVKETAKTITTRRYTIFYLLPARSVRNRCSNSILEFILQTGKNVWSEPLAGLKFQANISS